MFARAGNARSVVALVTTASYLALAGCSSESSSAPSGTAAYDLEQQIRQGSTYSAQPAQYEPVTVPSHQMPRLHVGNTIVGRQSNGTIYSYYHPNGTLYEAWQGYGVNVARYWFDGDALCVEYPQKRSPACYFVVVGNNEPYYVSASSGKPITNFSALYQGDVEGLAGASRRQQADNTLLWALGSVTALCAFFLDCFGGGGDAYAGDSGTGADSDFEAQRQKDQQDEWRRRSVVRRPYGGSGSPPVGDLYEEPNWGWKAPE